jgi:hypothetical protein
MWKQLPPEILMEMRGSVDEMSSNGSFHMGSVFTGTGSEKLCMKEGIEKPVARHFEMPFKVVHEYSCDHGELQEMFHNKSHPDVKHYFGTVAELATLTTNHHGPWAVNFQWFTCPGSGLIQIK